MILVLNLPFTKKIIRRYSCSYYAQGFLYPPQELLRVATIIKTKREVYFIDAVAENKTIDNIIKFIKDHKVNTVITLPGIEFINEDYDTIKTIEKATGTKFVIINYLANIYKEKFKEIVLGRDFEEKIFQSLEGNFLENLKKLQNKELKLNPNRIKYVDRSFINPNHYHELFAKGKTGFLYYSFGCPFNCNYCIRSYDIHGSIKRRKEYVFEELKMLYKEGYKNIRFLDDNITLDKRFLEDLNKFLKKEKIRFNFYGLSRIDLLDNEKIKLLREINFKRLYLGLETLNPQLQKYYNKNIDVSNIEKVFNELKRNKIERGTWIIYNPLFETKQDIIKTARRIRNITTFANISVLTPYPNTPFFDKEKNKISFNLMPFKSKINKRFNTKDIERTFFREYLKNPKNIFTYLKYATMFPKTTIEILKGLAFKDKKEREDFI